MKAKAEEESALNTAYISRVVTHPSLALIKYWGKADSVRNLPATPSLALTLDGLNTTTEVEVQFHGVSLIQAEGKDSVWIDGVQQTPERFTSFFNTVRIRAEGARGIEGTPVFTARSSSDFPSSAGMASSASGFAALSVACFAALGIESDTRELSAVARIGSASAARSLFGGFVRLDAGAETAEPVYDADWWPEIRVIVVEVDSGPKALSSRRAMEVSRTSSPYYQAWLADAPLLMNEAIEALGERKLEALGHAMRLSYLRMFSTMFSSDPPTLYWKPGSLEVIRLCEELRSDGISAWETMDAGPQVKIFCLSENLEAILRRFAVQLPAMPLRICKPGPGPRIIG